MSDSVIQADYAQLDEVSKRFKRGATEMTHLSKRLTSMVQKVQGGMWQGAAAVSFTSEMERDVMPAMHRLVEALSSASRDTHAISQILQQAEEEAAALFKGAASMAAISAAVGGVAMAMAAAASGAVPKEPSYVRIARRDQLRAQLASASPTQRAAIQRELATLDAALTKDGQAAQAILDKLRAATTAADRESLRTQLRDNPQLMEGLAATTTAPQFRTALTDLVVNQPGTISHTAAATADRLIRDKLSKYVSTSHQVEGDIAIINDANWDRAIDDLRSQMTSNVNAFVDDQGNIIIHHDRGNGGTAIHEGVHKYSNDAVRTQLSWHLNEGMTEYFSRQVIAGLPDGDAVNRQREATIYPSQRGVVNNLVSLVGEESVAKAYFDGNTAQLKRDYLAKTGRTEADWNRFLTHMDNQDWRGARDLLTPNPVPRPTPRRPGI